METRPTTVPASRALQTIPTLSFEDTLTRLQTRPSGLTSAEALERVRRFGQNSINGRHANLLTIVLRQITGNPLIIVLAVATFISFLLGQHISSYYIFGLIVVSVILGVWNEYGAEKTVEALLRKISPTTAVLRNDERTEIPVTQVTIGDIVLLSRGSIVPADLRLIEVQELQINQSALTGESAPVYKTADPLKTSSDDITELENIAFMGTSVDAGAGKGVVVRIGKDTAFGKIAQHAMYAKPQTEFEKGLSQFGSLLVKVILIFTVAIFVINGALGHPLLESLLFALAIAVGLTPELLPVIVTISLSHGAGLLAKKGVVAKQLIAIEDLGNMDVLCTDKTGTLTEGSIELVDFIDKHGKQDPSVLLASLYCNNAVVHRRISGSSIDTAVWHYALKHHIHPDPHATKLHSEPFDFYKKAMFSVTEENGKTILRASGAPEFVLDACKQGKDMDMLQKLYASKSADGLRVIAIAEKQVTRKDAYTWDDASGLTFVGFLTFLDVPKLSAKEALADLQRLNVDVKIITGDNEIVTEKICREVGMDIIGIMQGSDIEALSDEELAKRVGGVNVFTRTNPEQKMRVVKALRAIGHTVGYLGDGINDIPSLRNADVGISVNTAVDVAKDAASIVLLSTGLDVIAEGISEGRKTFANTIKYILMGTSSNFGNMFSAAGASFFLPFLPMTPVQILLTNGLYDLSQLSIPTDRVDDESLVKPRHWDISFIRDYMVFFGPISSLYDFLTFGVLIYFIHAHTALFQTGWFIESMATEILVVFVIRTSRTPFFKSRPSGWLAGTCLGIVLASVLLPFSPFAASLGFMAPPPLYFLLLVILVSTYLLLVEILKTRFLKKRYIL